MRLIVMESKMDVNFDMVIEGVRKPENLPLKTIAAVAPITPKNAT